MGQIAEWVVSTWVKKKGLSKNFDAGGVGYVHKFGIGRKVDVGQKNNVIFVPFFSITL